MIQNLGVSNTPGPSLKAETSWKNINFAEINSNVK